MGIHPNVVTGKRKLPLLIYATQDGWLIVTPLTNQVVLNHIDYLERLCDIFVSIEQWLERFSMYQAIFQASDRMQASIGLITQDIIDLGSEAVRFYRSNTLCTCEKPFACLIDLWQRLFSPLHGIKRWLV